MTIDQILDGILEREGWPQVTNRAADAGGLTRGGITFTSYEPWLRSKGQTITPTDFVNITEEDAKAFLLDGIASSFMAVRGVNEALFVLMFDWATTSGPDDPVRGLQQILRGTGATIAVDGVYGQKTHLALITYISRGVVDVVDGLTKRLAKDRVAFYVRLATDRDKAVAQFRKDNPTTNLENVNGWVNRALEFV